MLGLCAGQAQGATATDMHADGAILDQVLVVGKRQGIVDGIPGSAHYLGTEALQDLSYADINRVLQRVPGVYVRQEDGFGLFPNISLRGVDTSRSAKVTLLEDGILAAPAPYAAPAAYYSPTAGRMDGFEVLMGTSQAKYGPHITGGVINYLSTPIPEQLRASLRTQYGSDNEFRIHGVVGDTIDTKVGRFGYLLESYARRTDGFKRIDATPDLPATDATGFHTIEPMIKLAWEPNSAIYQRLELKYGYTDMNADETYLGLTTADFRTDPYRRYAASRFDNIDTTHHRTYLRYFVSPSDNLDLVTTVYYNDFKRNWYKLNDIRATTGGLSQNLNLSAALAGAASGQGLACLNGALACGLRVRANQRDYYSWGVQSEAAIRFETGTLHHALTLGTRYHNDEEGRFQHDDLYAQSANGTIGSVSQGAPGSQDNRKAEVGAVALFAQDQIDVGRWRLTPGVRYEYLELENQDHRTGQSSDGNMDMIAGGVGIAYLLNDEWQTFGGVHYGFSPPSPGAAANGLDEETSTAYELGLRYAREDAAATAELVNFLTRFDDLIVVTNIGGTGTGIDENFGRVDTYGVELSGRLALGEINDWSFRNDYFIAFTYTHAEQRNGARSTDAESIFSFGARGNEVPYIPPYQLTIGTTVDFKRWGGALSATFVDATFTSASNVINEVNGTGAPDARFGKTDAYEVVDLSVYGKVTERTKLFAGIYNLFDAEYIVSRQPHGPRPGLPRSWFVGVEFEI